MALIGFNATPGNDYESSFFRRGKENAWKLLEKYSRFRTMFAGLGNTWELSDENIELLEEFTYHIEGKVIRLMPSNTISMRAFITQKTKYKVEEPDGSDEVDEN